MKLYNWDQVEPMTEATVRTMHSSIDKFRIIKRQYKKGARFSGSMRAGRCYVLEGECRYIFEGIEIDIPATQYADLEQGSYDFEVLGDANVVLIKVWNLSDEFV